MLKTRILIADPDPDIGQTLKIYFEEHGSEVQLVNQLGAVLGAVRQWQPNAVLLSTEFTAGSPYQVSRQLIEDTLTAHIPIILILHLDERRLRLEALEAGVDTIVTKPLDIEELRLRVESAIRLSTMRLHV